MKSTHVFYALLLPQLLPQELRVCLAAYLYEVEGQNYLTCSELDVQGHFLELTILMSDGTYREWKIRLPTQYVLAIVDLSDKEVLPIGFHPHVR